MMDLIFLIGIIPWQVYLKQMWENGQQKLIWCQL